MPASKIRGRRKLGHTFIRISLILDQNATKASGDIFTDAVEAALTGLYGIVGGALDWDLIDFQKVNSTAIIRCRQSDEQRIWAASSFMTQLRGSPCRLQVLESSPSLHVATSVMAKSEIPEADATASLFRCVRKLGERATSDVIVRLRTIDGRDDWFYSHSEILSAKSRYFATRLSDDWPTYQILDSRACVEVICLESDVDHHVNLLRLFYSSTEEHVGDMWHSVKNALGMLKAATKLGCDAIASKCARYLEAVPWEENEEEEILMALPGLGAEVVPILARLQPVDSEAIRNVFLSAIRVATLPERKSYKLESFPSELKVAAQEQVEYMLVEDDDAPLLKADDQIKEELRNCFSKLFDGFKVELSALLAEPDPGIHFSEEVVLEKVSDLVWASRILPKVGLNLELVEFWLEASSDITRALKSEKLCKIFWDTKLRVVEISCKVLEAVGYGCVILTAEKRTRLVNMWLPFIRETKPLFDSLFAAEKMALQMDTELLQNIEGALVSLVLSLPSGDQAEILADWLNTEQARYPDLSEAFEVWCYRSKAAKRRLSTELPTGVKAISSGSAS